MLRCLPRRPSRDDAPASLAGGPLVAHTSGVLRLVLGLLKGGIIGAVVGFGANTLSWTGGFHWLTYGLVGALVGLFVGRPVWSHLMDKSSTVVVSVIKAVVGYGIGVGLFAIVAKAWGGFDLSISGETHNVYDWQYVLGAAIGALYGAFVELDDAVPASAGTKAKS